MPEPVFSSSDRIDGNIPADLARQLDGKPVAEQQSIIVKYYQSREKDLKDAAATAIARVNSGPGPTPPVNQPIVRATLPTQQQFFNDPAAAVKAMQDGLITKDEFNAQTEPFLKLATQVAENLASVGKEHWNRFLTEIRQVMGGCDAATQADPKSWDVAYNHVVGAHYSELRNEAVQKATTTAAEPPQGPPTPPPVPADLARIFQRDKPEKTALRVCEGLSISSDSYIKAMDAIDKGAPLNITVDNRQAR